MEQHTAPSPAPILVAVDGTNLLHRAHHAYSRTDRRSPSGEPTWALFGVARMLASVHREVTERFRTPTGLVVGFDGPRDMNRRRLTDAGYKSSRKDPDPDLVVQATAAPTWLRDAGINVVVSEPDEADDVCASAARAAADAGWRCVIVTSDRDALAHCSTAVRVLRPCNGGGFDVYGTAEVAARYDLPKVPGIYATFSALRGDTSDDLPGVPRVGDKTAAKALSALHAAERTVDDVLAGDPVACDAVGDKAAKLLTAGADAYRRNQTLMAPVFDIDVSLDAASAPVDGGHIAESCSYQGVVDAEAELLAAVDGRLLEPVDALF